MTDIPNRLVNGPGNAPDADKFMANYDWLTALVYGNFLFNGGFESWNAGTSFSNPSNNTPIANSWTYFKSGTSSPTADVARESTTIDTGSYSCKIDITGAGSANSIIRIDQVIANPTDLRGFTLSAGFKIKVSTGSKVRMKIDDGVNATYSTYHDGDGTWQHLYKAQLIDAAAASVTISVEIVSDFTGIIYIDGAYTYIIPALASTQMKAALFFSKFLQGKLSVDGGNLGGDVTWTYGTGPILTDANGHTYRLEIDTDGTLGRNQLT